MIDILGDYLGEWKNEREINYLIYGYSMVLLDSIGSLETLKDQLKSRNIKFDEIMEMRLFNEEKELFVYKYNNKWKRIMTEHNDKLEHYDRYYLIQNKFKKGDKYKSIKVRKYIDYENDMAYVKKTCLLGLIEGER